MSVQHNYGVVSMDYVDRIAEARIAKAASDGVFANLPGAGVPLPPDPAMRVPAALRPAYRMLDNAGYVPPELVRARDMHTLQDLLSTLDAHSDEADTARRRLRWLEVALAGSRHGRGLL